MLADLAAGLVYSVIAPLILGFILLTFCLFWVVIKNNVLYVVRTGNVDGGGLFFPSAINQLFTGLYFMEVCLIGLFFLVRDVHGNVACEAQGIIMSVSFVLTIFYQIWLAFNFQGLYKYAPVRLEADAARRDKEYELERLTKDLPDSGPGSEDTVREMRHLSQPHRTSHASLGIPEEERKQEVGYEQPPMRSRAGTAASFRSKDRKHESGYEPSPPPPLRSRAGTAASFRSKDMQAQQRRDGQAAKHILSRLNRPLDEARLAELENSLAQAEARVGNVLVPRRKDIERQMMNDPISKIIMQHNDELEDLDAEERDMLISVAFTHPVLRQTKPSVWIPTDDLGISEDEVRRTVQFSKDVAIDNRGAFFDKKLKVEVNKPPPDMSEFALVMAEL